MPSKDLASAAARVSNAKRWHSRDLAKVAEAERDLRAAQLADHVRRVVDTFPPLTAEQRSRLAALLKGGAADAG